MCAEHMMHYSLAILRLHIEGVFCDNIVYFEHLRPDSHFVTDSRWPVLTLSGMAQKMYFCV